jgi:hypothetical protein
MTPMGNLVAAQAYLRLAAWLRAIMVWGDHDVVGVVRFAFRDVAIVLAEGQTARDREMQSLPRRLLLQPVRDFGEDRPGDAPPLHHTVADAEMRTRTQRRGLKVTWSDIAKMIPSLASTLVNHLT